MVKYKDLKNKLGQCKSDESYYELLKGCPSFFEIFVLKA